MLCFAEVYGNPQTGPERTGTVIPTGRARQHNIQTREGQGIPVRLSPVPSGAESARSLHRTPPAESGESFAYGITDAHAAVALTLHPLDLFLGEQGIRHESVIPEHGEVEARAHAESLVGESTDRAGGTA